MTMAHATAAAVGLVAIFLAAASRHWNLQVMVTLSFRLGASAIAPALVYSLFWRRYNRTGLLSTLIGGALSVLVLITGTKLVSGSAQAIFPNDDFTWFPYTTTGLLPITVGSSRAGSVLSSVMAEGLVNRSRSTTRSRLLSWPTPSTVPRMIKNPH
jgi:Na+(H+)/acetate symporter ActP